MVQVSERSDDILRLLITLIGTAATYLWGGLDSVLTTLLVLACIDYITGVVSAAMRGKLDSSVGGRGIAKKIGIFAAVAVANILDGIFSAGDPILRTVACWWYCSNEGISILENLGEIGVPIPVKLKSAIARLRDEGDDHGGQGYHPDVTETSDSSVQEQDA